VRIAGLEMVSDIFEKMRMRKAGNIKKAVILKVYHCF